MASKYGPYTAFDSYDEKKGWGITEASGPAVLFFRDGKAAFLYTTQANAEAIAARLSADDSQYIALREKHYGADPNEATNDALNQALALLTVIGSINPAYNEIRQAISLIQAAQTLLNN